MAISKIQEQKWQAEEDAHTMARYQEILADGGRMKRAVKVAREQANDLTKRANAMNKVASTKTGSGSKRASKKK